MKKASERRYFELVTTITTTTNNNSGSSKKVKYSCSQKSKREKNKRMHSLKFPSHPLFRLPSSFPTLLLSLSAKTNKDEYVF